MSAVTSTRDGTGFTRQPVAVIGIGCRFPGADGLDAFWSMLLTGTDAITSNPNDRWDQQRYFDADPGVPGKTYCSTGGFLENGGSFDASFFGIASSEAARIDPQHGMVLEMAWQALESAAIVPASLSGKAIGVFVGLANSDFDRVWSKDFTRLDPVSVAGASFSVAANRLSYTLNLKGPSIAVDMACASSLGAIHLACQSLCTGECDMALAGGSRLILSPEQTIAFSDGKSIAQDGYCRSFDANANGLVWGEGCGMLLLKRLSDAQASADPILAVIGGSAVGHGGFSNGLGTPSPSAYIDVIQNALKNANLKPEHIRMIEAHGGGTVIADAIELRALATVFRRQEQHENSRCYVGSVKSCIGHLEAASGAAGLIKAILAIKNSYVPPHVNWRTANNLVELDGSRLAITDAGQPWPDGERCAGVSSFSLLGGAVAHVIVKQAPAIAARERQPHGEQFHILTLSARSQVALQRYAENYLEYLSSQLTGDSALELGDICFTTNVGRTHFGYRLAVVAQSPRDAIAALHEYCREGASPKLFAGLVSSSKPVLVMSFGEPNPRCLVSSSRIAEVDARLSRYYELRLHQLRHNSALWAENDELVSRNLRWATLCSSLAEWFCGFGLLPSRFISVGYVSDVSARLARDDIDSAGAAGMLRRYVPGHQSPLLQRGTESGVGLMPTNEAPATVLVHVGENDFAPHPLACTSISLSNDSTPAGWAEAIHKAIAAAFVQGARIDWEAVGLELGLRRRHAPTYPFERRRHIPVLPETHSSLPHRK